MLFCTQQLYKHNIHFWLCSDGSNRGKACKNTLLYGMYGCMDEFKSVWVHVFFSISRKTFHPIIFYDKWFHFIFKIQSKNIEIYTHSTHNFFVDKFDIRIWICSYLPKIPIIFTCFLFRNEKKEKKKIWITLYSVISSFFGWYT